MAPPYKHHKFKTLGNRNTLFTSCDPNTVSKNSHSVAIELTNTVLIFVRR